MNLMYTILQWTPFPGVYKPIPLWQLQCAEYDLHMNRQCYHEQAIIVGQRGHDALYYYPYDHAQKIIEYCLKLYPFARFMIIGGMTTQHTN